MREQTQKALLNILDVTQTSKRALEDARAHVMKRWMPNPRRKAIRVIDALLKD